MARKGTLSPIQMEPFGSAETWQSSDERAMANGGEITLQTSALMLDGYPFRQCVAFRPELRQLMRLLGVGAQAGNSILVTGKAGIGRTTLVNEAVYNTGFLGRGGIVYERDRNSHQNPGSSAEEHVDKVDAPEWERIERFCRALSSGSYPAMLLPNPKCRNLVLEVRPILDRSSTPASIIRSIVKAFYLALVESGICAIVPHLTSLARRSLSLMCAGNSLEHEDFQHLLEVTPLTDMRLPVNELDFAAAVKGELERAQALAADLIACAEERADFGIQRLIFPLGQGIASPTRAHIDTAAKLARWLNSSPALGEQNASVTISLVFILDHLDGAADSSDKTYRQTGELWAPEGCKGSEGFFSSALYSIVDFLQPLLASGTATFVVVADEGAALQWQREGTRAANDVILRNVFSGHIHLEPLGVREIRGLLRQESPAGSLATSIEVIRSHLDKAKILLIDEKTQNRTNGKNVIEEMLSYALFYRSGGHTKSVGILIDEMISKVMDYRLGVPWVYQLLEAAEYGNKLHYLLPDPDLVEIAATYGIYRSQLTAALLQVLDQEFMGPGDFELRTSLLFSKLCQTPETYEQYRQNIIVEILVSLATNRSNLLPVHFIRHADGDRDSSGAPIGIRERIRVKLHKTYSEMVSIHSNFRDAQYLNMSLFSLVG